MHPGPLRSICSRTFSRPMHPWTTNRLKQPRRRILVVALAVVLCRCVESCDMSWDLVSSCFDIQHGITGGYVPVW